MALANDGLIGLSNRFLVTVTPDNVNLGYWAKIEGLKVTWEMPDYRTGDQGNTRFYAPGFTKYPDVKLTRSAHPTDSKTVQEWLAKRSSAYEIGEVKISLYGPDKEKGVILEWVCKESTPIEWSIAPFDANSSNIALETLIFTHNGFLADDFKLE